ncbi:MAG: acyl-CoA thioesterase [Treponema sp.]|nr:acyl-CoA thioesterase [Treponema sp.]
MIPYMRKVNYHETDKMGITHHSNYIKYMEEARVEFLEKIGLPFETVEAEGIGSPVVSLGIDYKHPTEFSDVIRIEVSLLEYNGLKMKVGYKMVNEKTGDLVATAHSYHCFLKDGRLYSFRRDNNPMGLKLEGAVEKTEE